MNTFVIRRARVTVERKGEENKGRRRRRKKEEEKKKKTQVWNSCLEILYGIVG